MASLEERLGDHMHIHRVAAIEEIERTLQGDDKEAVAATYEPMILRLCQQTEIWEAKAGGFGASKAILPFHHTDEFCDKLVELCTSNLEHPESRVRLVCGEVLGVMCKVRGSQIYARVEEAILESIERNFERQLGGKDDREDTDAVMKTGQTPPQSPSQTHSHLSHGHGHAHQHHDHENNRAAEVEEDRLVRQGKLTHDTAGWKCLETSMSALRRCIDGCGSSFAPFISRRVLSRLRICCDHTNRFVREIAFFCYASLVAASELDVVESISSDLVDALSTGLGDNWSQVRFAASTATRAFVIKAEPFKHKYLSVLAPRMCLNRHYVAEGVRLYSMDTWKTAMGTTGRDTIAKYVDETVTYYVSQAHADNHAVREAACHCMAELAVRVDKEAVSKHVGTLLQALVDAFKDESWPVRDAACQASGEFVRAYGPACESALLNELLDLFIEHLSDNIRSVREDSAVALRKCMDSVPEATTQKLSQWLDSHLADVKAQPVESYSFGELTNTTQFGVAAKKQRDNDDKLHTDQQTFSCGSLAPRLKRGGGCMDHGFARARQPWEYSEGALHLLRELCVPVSESQEASPHLEFAAPFIPRLADVARARHFAHHVYLQETLWKSIIVISKALGVNKFYSHLSIFVPEAVITLVCGHRLAESAAADALQGLIKMYGRDEVCALLTSGEVEKMNASEFMGKPKRRIPQKN